MERLLKLGVFLMVMPLAFGSTFVQAFSSATHIYIAEQVFQDCRRKIDLHYGSIEPDLALYLEQPEKWPTAFTDTHYDYIDLNPNAWSLAQKAFDKGWRTHNEYWGADYYAHIEYPPGSGMGYVIGKAEILSEQTGLEHEFAHFAIEVAIDLLLKNDDPNLGEKLLKASLLRSRENRRLLVKVFVWGERTDWVTLASAEWTFRYLVARYAIAFFLPSPIDKQVLALLGAQLALEIYGIEVSPDELLMILESAISLCQNDYKSGGLGYVQLAMMVAEIRHAMVLR